jgi:hypothetical protein
MTEDPTPPTVPESRLRADGWERFDTSAETLVDLPTVRVRGHTVVYEDERTRSAVRAATDGDLDRPWRFFFATRLSFVPPLVPGVGTASWYPTVREESRRGFEDDLRERGFERLSRGSGERVRVGGGRRATLTRYDARLPIDRGGDVVRLDVEAWVGVWGREGEFRVAGGGYPIDLRRALGPDEGTDFPVADLASYRSDLFELVRAVE